MSNWPMPRNCIEGLMLSTAHSSGVGGWEGIMDSSADCARGEPDLTRSNGAAHTAPQCQPKGHLQLLPTCGVDGRAGEQPLRRNPSRLYFEQLWQREAYRLR